ncbi:MAG TPA: hypothetical protein VHM30_06080 [Gemmatimonadaceae bacterium]|nr:hypothetical protein [Gemmatimonadaceae bacterium]
MRHRVLPIAPLAALILACATDAPRLRVAVEGSTFQRAPGASPGTWVAASIPFTITNIGEKSAFVPACGGRPLPQIQQFVAGHWELYAGGYCLANVSMVPRELRVEESYSGTAAIDQPGRFRLYFGYADGPAIADSRRYDALSAPFDVR